MSWKGESVFISSLEGRSYYIISEHVSTKQDVKVERLKTNWDGHLCSRMLVSYLHQGNEDLFKAGNTTITC